MKKSIKNLNKVMCNSIRSVFKEDDDCSYFLMHFLVLVLDFCCLLLLLAFVAYTLQFSLDEQEESVTKCILSLGKVHSIMLRQTQYELVAHNI